MNAKRLTTHRGRSGTRRIRCLQVGLTVTNQTLRPNACEMTLHGCGLNLESGLVRPGLPRRLLIAVSSVLAGLCVALAATPAGAATVTIRPARPAVGSSVVVDLNGFARRTAVSVRLAGRVVALARTGPAGGASMRFAESRRAKTGRVSLSTGTHQSRIRAVIRVLSIRPATATSLTADLGTLRALLSPSALTRA